MKGIVALYSNSASQKRPVPRASMGTSSSWKRRQAAEPPGLKEAREQLSKREQKWAVLQAKHEAVLQQIEDEKASARLVRMRLAREISRSGKSEETLFLRQEADDFRKAAEDLHASLPTLEEDMQRTISEITELKQQIEDLCTKTYFDHIVEAGPPSTAERAGLYAIQTEGEGAPLFQCCFPATAQPPLPLTLAHPVFGDFVDDFNNVEAPLDPAVCKFVENLCYEVLGGTEHTCEAEMNRAFNILMSKFLGSMVARVDVSCKGAGVCSVAETDGTAVFEEKWLMLNEVEWEKGNTLVQGLETYAFYVGSLQQAGKQSAMGLLPCFFVEVIGPAIRIGALVYLKKVAWQPLTPFLNCFYTEYDRTDMATLCRAMRALKKGVAALGSYYKDSPSITAKDVPYSLWKRHCSRIDRKLVFVVTLDDGHKRLFKYCRQYGNEVHKSWADAGLAPVLYDCQLIAGGWLEVEMEYLEGWSSAFSLLKSLDFDARAQLQAAISVALDKALSINIDGCCVAHGDMRPPNIMAKRVEGGFDVKFIDFDWAGRVDTTSYPPFMNDKLPWAAGVGTGSLLEQKHDKWTFKHSFAEILPPRL